MRDSLKNKCHMRRSIGMIAMIVAGPWRSNGSLFRGGQPSGAARMRPVVLPFTSEDPGTRNGVALRTR